MSPQTITARAHFVATRIDTRALEKDGAIAHAPLVRRAGEHGRIVVFRVGTSLYERWRG